MVYHYDGRTDNMQQLQWNVKNVDLACCMYALALATNYITKDEMIIERVLQVYIRTILALARNCSIERGKPKKT